MLIPERTVDSLLAYELLHAFPEAILWSPTNTAGSLDHALRVGGAHAILFECKGIQNPKPPDRWEIEIRAKQLDDYVTKGLGGIIYLLPSKPTDTETPWLRDCLTDTDLHGHCRACAAPRGSERRRWAGRRPHVSTALPESRLQPWFNHWAWCIPATDLQVYLGRPTRDVRISADDVFLAAIPGAQRLCHMLPRDGTTTPNIEPDDGKLPGSAFSGNELSADQIASFWARNTTEDDRNVRPGSLGLIY